MTGVSGPTDFKKIVLIIIQKKLEVSGDLFSRFLVLTQQVPCYVYKNKNPVIWQKLGTQSFKFNCVLAPVASDDLQ